MTPGRYDREETVGALMGIEQELEMIRINLDIIAAIQQRRERERVTRRLAELERVAAMAEARSDQSDERAKTYIETPENGWNAEVVRQQARMDFIAATNAREAVNHYRLIYSDVLTLGDVTAVTS